MTQHDKAAINRVAEDIIESCRMMITNQTPPGQWLQQVHSSLRSAQVIMQPPLPHVQPAKPSLAWRDYSSDTRVIDFAVAHNITLPKGNYRRWWWLKEEDQGKGRVIGIQDKKSKRDIITGHMRITDGVIGWVEREGSRDVIMVHRCNWKLDDIQPASPAGENGQGKSKKPKYMLSMAEYLKDL